MGGRGRRTMGSLSLSIVFFSLCSVCTAHRVPAALLWEHYSRLLPHHYHSYSLSLLLLLLYITMTTVHCDREWAASTSTSDREGARPVGAKKNFVGVGISFLVLGLRRLSTRSTSTKAHYSLFILLPVHNVSS